jgi:hypothetical protein
VVAVAVAGPGAVITKNALSTTKGNRVNSHHHPHCLAEVEQTCAVAAIANMDSQQHITLVKSKYLGSKDQQ